MKTLDIKALDWEKMTDLIPAIIQHADDGTVLMLGYMNREALQTSQTHGQLTLYSRSRQQLWRKGETSGNTMRVVSIATDCDSDSLLVQVKPAGPGCHLGFKSCFQGGSSPKTTFLGDLCQLIAERDKSGNAEAYTSTLLQSGIKRCAQKVGEEAAEVIIAAIAADREELIEESADLLFHWLVLLQACGLDLYTVIDCLKKRNEAG